MKLTIALDHEEDGRWIADIPELPGVLKYGVSREDAILQAKILALEVIASELKHGERRADLESIEFCVAAEAALAA